MSTKEDWPRPYDGEKFREGYQNIKGFRHNEKIQQLRVGQIKDGKKYLGNGGFEYVNVAEPSLNEPQ